MDAERAADAAEADEQVDELRPRRQQLGELVDDDQQIRHRRHRRVGLAARLVGDDVVEVAGLAQHRLAALLLADQRRVHAVDQRQVALQVGDQAGHVREPRQLRERRAALVVDEHERELLGRVLGGQAGHQRAQQLALARAGRADEHAVRAHAALGRLLEVELEHVAVGRAADRHAQAVGPPAALPIALQAAEHLAQAHRGAQPALAVAALGQLERRQRAGDRLAGAQVGLVEEHLGDRRRVLAPQLPEARAALGHRQPRVDVRGLEVALLGQEDQDGLELARAGQQLAEGGDLVDRVVGPVAVEDHDQLGRHQRHLAAAHVGLGEPPQLLQARAQLGLEQRLHVTRRAGDQEVAGDVRVHALVREPLAPLPLFGLVAVERREHPHVVRRAPRGQLRHEGARPGPRAGAVAGDGEHADPVQADDDGLAAQRLAAVDHLARLLQRLRLVLGERVHPEVEVDLAVQRHGIRCPRARAGSPCGRGGAPRRSGA